MAKIQRNQPCPCGSKLKYKHCCLRRHGGERIKEKFYTGHDRRKEMVKRLIKINHENRMNEIIERKTNVGTDK